MPYDETPHGRGDGGGGDGRRKHENIAKFVERCELEVIKAAVVNNKCIGCTVYALGTTMLGKWLAARTAREVRGSDVDITSEAVMAVIEKEMEEMFDDIMSAHFEAFTEILRLREKHGRD